MTYFDDFCVIQDHTLRTLIGAGEQREGGYCYKKPTSNQVNTVSTRWLWHKRRGHPSDDKLSLLSHSLGANCGLNKIKDKLWEICLRAKQTRSTFPTCKSIAKNVFDLIHCDIWSSHRTPSSCGAHYFLSILDDASRGTWVYLMRDRTEASKLLQGFITMVQHQFNTNVKVVRSDNWSEFTSGPTKEFYFSQGVLRESSCIDTPQQNGRVECNHRHILNVARALRLQACMPIEFWGVRHT